MHNSPHIYYSLPQKERPAYIDLPKENSKSEKVIFHQRKRWISER